MAEDGIYGHVKLTAAALANLNRRRSEVDWLRLAYQSTVDQGPLEEYEGRMLEFLEGKIATAKEQKALQGRIQDFRRSGIPEDALTEARARVRHEGGVSNSHAQELGYADLAAFRRFKPRDS
jgi:hypothetical protein